MSSLGFRDFAAWGSGLRVWGLPGHPSCRRSCIESFRPEHFRAKGSARLRNQPANAVYQEKGPLKRALMVPLSGYKGYIGG